MKPSLVGILLGWFSTIYTSYLFGIKLTVQAWILRAFVILADLGEEKRQI